MVIAAMKLKDAYSLEGKLWPTQIAYSKARGITLPTKVGLVKAMVFPVVMYGCESWTEESWALKNWCFLTFLVLEKTLESPLDCKEIQPVHSEGDQSWVFSGRTDAKAETPVLWPPHAKSWLIGKDSDAGRDWGQEEKGTTEDEMARCHYWLNGLSLSELREVVMDREAWRAAIHGVAKSLTRLNKWTEDIFVVQWLRICLPVQGTWVRTLVGELRSPHAAGQLSVHAATAEPARYNQRNPFTEKNDLACHS